MRFQDASDSNGYAGTHAETERTAEREVDEVAIALAALRRRWWIPALAVALALAGAWQFNARQSVVFTASAMIRREVSNPIADPFQFVRPSRLLVMEGDREIIRSSVVLAPVVERFGLRLQFRNLVVNRSLIRDVRVGEHAPTGLILVRKGDEAILRMSDGPLELARAPLGEVLSVEGLSLRPMPGSLADGDEVALEVMAPEVAFLRILGQLDAEPVENTGILSISYTDRDPELAAAVANAVSESFQTYRRVRATESAQRRREFIEGQLDEAYDSLRVAQEELLLYQETTRTLNPDTEAQLMATSLFSAEEVLRSMRFRETMLAGLIAPTDEAGEAQNTHQRLLTAGSDLIPAASELSERLQVLETQRSRLTASRFGFTEAGPEVEVLDSLIRTVRRDITAAADEALRFLSAEREGQETRVRELRRGLQALPSRNSQYSRLRQRAARFQESVNRLAGRYSDARIAEALEVGDIEFVDRAIVPLSPDPGQTSLSFTLAILAGLLVGTGGVRVAEGMDQAVRCIQDATQASACELLAVIPHISPAGRNGTGPGGQLSANSPGDEALRALRTHIRFARSSEAKCIAVTSPEPGEGKSFLAARLALIVASEGRSVLLIDGDLRRPVLHHTFGQPRTPGVTDVLVQAASLDECIRRMPELGLDFLPAGTLSKHSAGLLGDVSFVHLLAAVEERYDTVVIDTSPVMAVTDSVLVGRSADAVILVARAEKSHKATLRTAAQELRRVGCEIIGLVLNDVRRGRFGESYGRYQYGEYEGYGAAGGGETAAGVLTE